jgi:hypothetical protein
MMAAPLRWYVLRVRLGFEALVASELRKRNLTVFLPFRRNSNRADRIPIELGRMAFPGYVFARSMSGTQSDLFQACFLSPVSRNRSL